MFNCCVGTGIGASAAFNAFFDVFCNRFAVDQLKDLNGAGGDAFTSAFAFIVVDGDGDIPFFEFFLHNNLTSFVVNRVTTAIILDFLSSAWMLVKKYQGSFIKKYPLENQKTNQSAFYVFMHEAIYCYNEQAS
jgi:hypothetical protein